MLTQAFGDRITSVDALRKIIPYPPEMNIRKQLPALDDHCRAFIARSRFLLLGTSNQAGTCDVSPKGDAAGFVQIIDEKTLVIPDRPGNRRADTLLNIIENPHIGLLFLIPGVEETLRVNGQATIVQDGAIFERMTVNGKRPLLAIAVQVEEAFLHCAKALKRSELWNHDQWISRDELPSLAQMLVDQTKLPDCTVEQMEEFIEDSYKNRLY